MGMRIVERRGLLGSCVPEIIATPEEFDDATMHTVMELELVHESAAKVEQNGYEFRIYDDVKRPR
jgi:hypothetical protein